MDGKTKCMCVFIAILLLIAMVYKESFISGGCNCG